ncbi:MAG: hypothetical protein AAGA48_28850 [Myxococcota bacterium]
MNLGRVVLGFSGACAMGAFAAWAFRPAPSDPAPEPMVRSVQQRPAARQARPLCQALSSLQDEVAQLQQVTEELERAIAAERFTTAAIEGTPLEWPDELDPRFHEEGVEAALLDAFEEIGGGAVVGLDCSEFPCVVVVEFPSDQFEEPIAAGNQLSVVLQDRGYDVWGQAQVIGNDDEEVWAYLPTLAVMPPQGTRGRPDGEVLGKRLTFRYRDLEDAVRGSSP